MIYINDVQEDTLAVDVYSGGSAVTRTVDIDCFDGNSVSVVYPSGVTSVANAVVEFKQADEVSWTNIETTEYDLSSFAGTRETFQIRITPGTVTSVKVEDWQFRVGPPAVVTEYSFVYNDDADEIYNDDADLVRVIV